MLKRVLIANRGEIAIRIARAAASLGMESVAVYAPADAHSLHTKLASTARELNVRCASTDPVRAYLDIDALLAIARETACDCVHPGYGFLAENANFPERSVSARATRSQSVAENVTPFQREQAWYELTKAVMAEIDDELERQIRSNFLQYLVG